MPIVSPKLKKADAKLVMWDPRPETSTKNEIPGIIWDAITDVEVVCKPSNAEYNIQPRQAIRFTLDGGTEEATILEVPRDHGTTYELINTLLKVGHKTSLKYAVYSRKIDGRAGVWICPPSNTKERAPRFFEWDEANSCMKGVPSAKPYVDKDMEKRYDWTEVEAFWRDQFAILYKSITLETFVEPTWPERKDNILNKLKARLSTSDADQIQKTWDSVTAFIKEKVLSPEDQLEISNALIELYKSKGGAAGTLTAVGYKPEAKAKADGPDDNDGFGDADGPEDAPAADDDLPF